MAGWKLGSLLRELREGRLHDTSSQVAGASDYLWSDHRLVNYINEAVRRFARRSLVIRDETSSITKITTVAYQETYPLDPSIISVLSVRMGQDPVTGNWDHTDLARGSHSAFGTYTQPDSYFFDPSYLSNLQPGKPLAFGTDEDIVADPNGSFGVLNLRLYPITSPTYAGMTGKMRVIREPINDLVLSNLNAYPEIPASHHLDILDWAAYLALSNVDTDVAGGDAPERAENFAKKFEMHCQDAKREVMRKMFAPLLWGFGQNGFTWETYP